MKAILVAVACLLLAVSAAAQEKQQAAKPPASAPALESKVRKVWESFKNKQKDALAAQLADGFHQVEEGGSGFGDMKSELAMMDEFELKTYTLKDFRVTPLGPHSALVRYLTHYEGTDSGEAIKTDSGFGEVWTLEGNDWKALYIQETKIK
ncbi:MAG TPA: nuclear transport factor 2 family protein [Candidatus Sulfotelmatobacter sp.]|jgi:hypothetical protein|nr:nuclear transport factor 2 family protein [Candidatus Sulfotelmatobacter sp.]